MEAGALVASGTATVGLVSAAIWAVAATVAMVAEPLVLTAGEKAMDAVGSVAEMAKAVV